MDSLPAGADARSLHQSASQDDTDLRIVIETMTKKYIIEGQMIRDEVEKRLAKNRKDIRILYRCVVKVCTLIHSAFIKIDEEI